MSLPDFSLSRYCIDGTAVSAIVALTSTPTRTKPPQAADLVPPFTIYYYVRTPSIPPQVAGSASGTPHSKAARRKTMVPHLHSVLRVPDLHAVAGAGLRHHAPRPDVSSSAHPCPQTTRMPEHAIFSKERCRHPAVQCSALTAWQMQTSYLRLCALSVSAYARCRLLARRMPCLCELPRIPRQTYNRHHNHSFSHCGLCSAGYYLHAACCSLFVIAYDGPLHRAAVPLSLGLAKSEQDQHQTAIIISCTRRRTNQDSDCLHPARLSLRTKRQYPESQTQKMMHSTPARPGTQPIPFLPAL